MLSAGDQLYLHTSFHYVSAEQYQVSIINTADTGLRLISSTEIGIVQYQILMWPEAPITQSGTVFSSLSPRDNQPLHRSLL